MAIDEVYGRDDVVDVVNVGGLKYCEKFVERGDIIVNLGVVLYKSKKKFFIILCKKIIL